MTGERKSSHTLAGGGLADHRLGDTRRMVPRPSCSPRQPPRNPLGSLRAPSPARPHGRGGLFNLHSREGRTGGAVQLGDEADPRPFLLNPPFRLFVAVPSGAEYGNSAAGGSLSLRR